MNDNVFCISTLFFFFKQKTAYELRISDWSSDVCSSDLGLPRTEAHLNARRQFMEARKEWPLSMQGFMDRFLIQDDMPRYGGSKAMQIGRASWRERVCQYVSIAVDAVSLKQKTNNHRNTSRRIKIKTNKSKRECK